MSDDFNHETGEIITIAADTRRMTNPCGELFAAMALAQASIENVAKDGINPAFKSKYARLGEVLDEVRPKYAAQGIAIMQMPINGEGNQIGVVTLFAHKSGQWLESTLYVAPVKFDAQGAGSVITYLRRYALMAMAGVAPDDDDSNAAVAQPMTSGPITTAQRDTLMTLAGEAGANLPAFYDYMGVAKMADIPARDYKKAEAALLAKIKQGAGK
jgi:hypothetical protein